MQQINALPNQTNALPANTLDLKDIHVPEQISNLPTAYGWWLLAVVIIVIIVATLINVRKKAKQNKVRKQALVQLKNNVNMSNNDIIALLKWAAMHYFSRTEIAKLFGHSLQSFLMSKLPVKNQKNFSELSEQAFSNQYQVASSEQTDKKLQQAATLWLTQALPPQPLKKITSETKNIQPGVSA